MGGPPPPFAAALPVFNGANKIVYTVFWTTTGDPSGQLGGPPSIHFEAGAPFLRTFANIVNGGGAGIDKRVALLVDPLNPDPIKIGAAIPLPATVWLFGSGLFGMIGMARRKKAV